MQTNKSIAMTALLFAQLMANAGNTGIEPPTLRPGKIHPSWEKIQLTKAERKGKTWEEQQELRKEKYEELKGISSI